MADQVEQLNLIVMAITVFIKQAPMHQILQWHLFYAMGGRQPEFCLFTFLGESFNERLVADYLMEEFRKLGIQLSEDGSVEVVNADA